jgi:hypothetical protein
MTRTLQHCREPFQIARDEMFEPERRAINQLLDEVRIEILKKDAAVNGFNFTYVSIDEQGYPQEIQRDGAPIAT